MTDDNITVKKLLKKLANLFDASLLDTRLAYGINSALREMTGFPKWKAMPVWQQHGYYVDQPIFKPDLEEAGRAGIMLVYSNREKTAWSQVSKIPCYVAGPMLTHYRKFKGWEPRPDAEGTVFYAGHSTADVRSEYSLECLHKTLSGLPEQYHPITISLHCYDYYELHLNEAFEKLGYRVVTAGHANDPEFPARFYEILSGCKYACSNDIGTYILYALDMNIPFFFVGERSRNIFLENNFNDIPAGEFDISRQPIARRVFELFDTGPVSCITEEQRKWFEQETGYGEQIPMEELKELISRPEYWFPATLKSFLLHLILGMDRIRKK
ncbi:MAG: hypothetical protein E7055_10175 [Lentisphaerae bacterium]|nr:hypothetical protein [Lentisphaerota bacterium]